MGLNNSQMLPDRVRKMRQMEDILRVEDNALALFEAQIDELYQRASRLHEELINEKWLETRLEEQTGAEAKVIGTAEELLASIILNVSDVPSVELKSVRKFIEKWLPAHLRYHVILLLSYASQIYEEIIIRNIQFRMSVPFWGGKLLDGSWMLDGSVILNSKRRYGLTLRLVFRLGEFYTQETVGNVTVVTKTRDYWFLDGTVLLDGSRKLNSIYKEEAAE